MTNTEVPSDLGQRGLYLLDGSWEIFVRFLSMTGSDAPLEIVLAPHGAVFDYPYLLFDTPENYTLWMLKYG